MTRTRRKYIMGRFSFKELEELGFEYVKDGDFEEYHQYILDKKNEFYSDFLYSEKVAIGTYRVLQHNEGEDKELTLTDIIKLMANGE